MCDVSKVVSMNSIDAIMLALFREGYSEGEIKEAFYNAQDVFDEERSELWVVELVVKKRPEEVTPEKWDWAALLDMTHEDFEIRSVEPLK